MPFNSKTYHRNKYRKLAKKDLAEGKAFRDGTHPLCQVLSSERINERIAMAVRGAKVWRNLAAAQ